jgi:hypothetical protein
VTASLPDFIPDESGVLWASISYAKWVWSCLALSHGHTGAFALVVSFMAEAPALSPSQRWDVQLADGT